MTYYNEQLKSLQQQTARKRQLEAMLADLRKQREELSRKESELKAVMDDELEDVAQLEGHTLKAFFFGVLGKKEEKLYEERAEAYAARMKYDAAVRELSLAEADIQEAEAERMSLLGCEERYEQLLQEKAAALKATGAQAAQEILRLEEKLAFLESRREELQEAVAAGNAALRSAKRALSSLDKAEDYATWDTFGGGILVDMAKHDELDEAQAHISTLQSQLRTFKTELADVTIDADIQISIDGFLHFADFFFDGFLSSMAVMDKITEAQNKVRRTVGQIEQVQSRLDQLLQINDREREAAKEELDHLIVHA